MNEARYCNRNDARQVAGDKLVRKFERNSVMNRFAHCFARRLPAALVACVALASWAQSDYPSKPIRLVVPYVAGGTTDVLARLIGTRLTEAWGRQVIVDNRGGGETIIGTDIVAKAAPDGYTMGMFNGTVYSVNPYILKNLPYDTAKDFAPITLVVLVPGVMTMNPKVAASNLKEVIALAKAKPGQLSYAAAGITSGQLTMELIKQMAGVDIPMIPYKGAGAFIPDLVSGQVQLTIGSPPSVLPFIKAGRLKAIVTTGAKRSSGLPDVPTIAESGFPGFSTYEWYGLFAPGKIPVDRLAKLNKEIASIIHLPDVSERMQAQGTEPVGNSSAEFARFIKGEMARWGPLAQKLAIRP